MDPAAVEAAIAQQVGEILNELMPALATTAQKIRWLKLERKSLRMIQPSYNVKAMNDQMNFQIDQAKLQQAYELSSTKTKLTREYC